MTLYILICAALVAAILLPFVPALRKSKSTIALIVLVPATAALLYWNLGHRTWERDLSAVKDLSARASQLEDRIRANPRDAEALIDLAEVLVQQDERSIVGKAGELIERSIAVAPDHPKALWYGAISALSSGKLPVARERLQKILAQNPPENIRLIIERQIQDIGQQLGETQAAGQRSLTVDVSIEPKLLQGLDKTTTLFVLARDPVNAGPPLAVTRRAVGDLPFKVTLSDQDAMLAGRGISSVPSVQVVARVSKSGSPQAQPGDLYGDAVVKFTEAQSIAVKIHIDRKSEK